ncbi:MAG: hypothetical protein U0841_22740 [Chloroflexia bacterium]
MRIQRAMLLGERRAEGSEVRCERQGGIEGDRLPRDDQVGAERSGEVVERVAEVLPCLGLVYPVGKELGQRFAGVWAACDDQVDEERNGLAPRQADWLVREGDPREAEDAQAQHDPLPVPWPSPDAAGSPV